MGAKAVEQKNSTAFLIWNNSSRHGGHRRRRLHLVLVIFQRGRDDDGFPGVGVMHGGAAVPQRGLGEAFGHAGCIGALSPRVAVAMERDVTDARQQALVGEPFGADMGFFLRDAGKQRADGRQVAQDGFQLFADGDLRPRAGLLPEIGDRPVLPVDVLGAERGGVGLRGTGFPEQLQVKVPLGTFGERQKPFLFRQRDAAPGFVTIFRPEIRGDDGEGDPAQAEGETVEAFQEKHLGRFGALHEFKEIGGGGFQQGLVADQVKGGGPENAGVALAAAVPAAGLHQVHDGLPGAQQEGGVTGGEVGAGELQIEDGAAVRLVGGFDQLAGDGRVARGQALLLASGRVLRIIDAVAAEQGELRFHGSNPNLTTEGHHAVKV